MSSAAPADGLIPFHFEHVEIMDVRSIEVEDLMLMPDAYDRIRLLEEQSLECYSLLKDHRILCAMGVIEKWPGVGVVWLLPSKQVSRHKDFFCRTVKEQLDRIMDQYKLHRMESPAVDDNLHARFMRFLGFQREGLMRGYSWIKRDYAMYAKVQL